VLKVEGLDTAYGNSQVLFGMTLSVGQGEVVTLLGRNGMGKSTTVHSIMGLVASRAGSITFLDTPLRGLASHRIARLGLGLVPEGRQIFPNLSVTENLVATAANRHNISEPWTLDGVLTLFPSLRERSSHMGNQLSGGEQQMLAVARALMTNPHLLILDEATEGLAPIIRQEIWQVLEVVKARGQAILVIDKNVAALTRIASRHYIIEKGQVVWEGNSDQLRASKDVQQRYLGV
jgi:branched-chain amino acid transport system ATP-binding protein